jgi:hypothetical protein
MLVTRTIGGFMFRYGSILMLLVLTMLCVPIASIAAVKSHSGTVIVSVDLSGHQIGKEAELWLPYPVSDKDQAITDVNINGDFARSAIYTDNVYVRQSCMQWDKRS